MYYTTIKEIEARAKRLKKHIVNIRKENKYIVMDIIDPQTSGLVPFHSSIRVKIRNY